MMDKKVLADKLRVYLGIDDDLVSDDDLLFAAEGTIAEAKCRMDIAVQDFKEKALGSFQKGLMRVRGSAKKK